MRRECEETERTLKERVSKLESHRLELEEELSRQKAATVSERLSGEEQLIMAKQRIKGEEVSTVYLQNLDLR